METIRNTELKIKTWWDLRHGSATVMEIYALVISEAMGYREDAVKKEYPAGDRRVYEAISNKLYQIAAALEMTEEINPAKK